MSIIFKISKMKALFIFCLIAVCYADQSFPYLPDAFLVNIEANMLEHNQTLNVREFQDVANKLSRYEFYTAVNGTVIIENRNEMVSYTIVDGEKCEVKKIEGKSSLPPGSTADFYQFGQVENYTYVGVDEVRGVPCDTWVSVENFVDEDNVNTQLTITFYFTVPYWTFRAAGVSKKPTRAMLESRKVYANGTVTDALHYYELINFVNAVPAPALFEPPTICLSGVQQAEEILSSRTGQGLAALMFFLGFVVAIVGAILVIYIYTKSKQMEERKFEMMSLSGNAS